MGDFTIENAGYFGIILRQKGVAIEISKSSQEDIYFRSHGNASIIVSRYSSDDDEREVYCILWYLMKGIVGQYFLTSDQIKDFVDIERKTITIFSDLEYDVLKITFNEDKKEISIATIKDEKDNRPENVMIRVRNGNGGKHSEYFGTIDSVYRSLKKRADIAMERKENKEKEFVKESNKKE